MFADYFTMKIGEATVKGRRLTLKELRANHDEYVGGSLSADRCVELIKEHVTLEDGSSFDPCDLTPGQLRELVAELVLPKEGRGISDFIGLLS